MRNILLGALLLMACCHSHKVEKNMKYCIEIWDMDYSMAHTVFYYVNNDSLIVKSISDIVGEKDKILMERQLNENERERVSNFLSSFSIDALKERYVNQLIEDGDRKKVKLQIAAKTKIIEISNFYQKDIGELFEVINQIVDHELKIKYKK